MSGYDVEHGVKLDFGDKSNARRPDLSSFYASINETYGDSKVTNRHAKPEPGNVTAVHRHLADAYELMLADQSSNPLLSGMISELDQLALHPPTESQGVPESFIDGLERVPKKELKKDDECAICTNTHLSDEYPLVVELPCKGAHRFDMECIRPWLALKSTCPLCRTELLKKKDDAKKGKAQEVEEDEEEYDSFYA